MSKDTIYSIFVVIAFFAVLALVFKYTEPEIISPIPKASAHGMSITPTPTPKNPSKTEIIAYIAKVFEKEGTAVQVRAIRCFYSESGLRTDAYNHNPARYDENGNLLRAASEDFSVAQVNTVHVKRFGEGFKHDAYKNIEVAYQIWKERGFLAWYGKDCN
jgi:hypothetical protein